MALDCRDHKQALHNQGKSHVTSFTSGKTLPYKLAESISEQPVIPSPNLFSDFPDSESKGVRLPTVSECAAHLELLETFYVLRQRILRSAKMDSAMGVVPERETKTGANNDTKVLKDPKLWEKRQIKWSVFVEFSVVRFLVWRSTISRTHPESGSDGRAGMVKEFFLPPVDVLIVWHALMLNPRLFRAHCEAEPLYRMAMPWRKVDELIDGNTWGLALPDTAKANFESHTNLSEDLFAFLEAWPPVPKTDTAQPNGGTPVAVLQVPRATALTLDAKANPPSGPKFPTEGHPEIHRYIDQFKRASQTDLAVQLRDAVIRQTSFIDKMNNHLWIRSPFAFSTLRRGISRYEKFLELMRLHPRQMFVPTLDIDLVWHTHQCQAFMYAKGTNKIVGRFINHDDSIEQKKLIDGSGVTSKMWRVRYGTEYRVCGCWDCEGLVSVLESAEEEPREMENIVRKVAGQVMYHRAVEAARRAGGKLPKFPMEVL